MEKAEAHNLLKNTEIQTKTNNTINSLNKSKVASKAFAANTQQKNFQKRNRALRQHLSQAAAYARESSAVRVSCV